MPRGLGLVMAAMVLAASSKTGAQAAATGASRLRVFVDCQTSCDFDFIRTELTWVDHVRDRRDADVHVLITGQLTAGGGVRHTLTFIGLRGFEGAADTLSYVSLESDSRDARRRGLTETLKLGLVRYAARLSSSPQLTVGVRALPGAAPPAPSRDRWNFWVLRVRGNSFLFGEKSQKFTNVFGSLSANRITEAWKVQVSANGNYDEQSFTFSGGNRFKSYRHGYGATTLLVKSLGRQWSGGQHATISSSTFFNQTLAFRLAPAVEYNFFPYAQSTRRQLTVRYGLGVAHFRYEDTTIFDKIRETRGDQTITFFADFRQPWGSLSSSLEGAAFLNDLGKNHLIWSTSMDLRIVRGLSFNLFSNVSMIRDQISLAAGSLTDEEILLRRRQLATSYRYNASIGLSYTFGSIFSNIVNPRFGGSLGGVVFSF